MDDWKDRAKNSIKKQLTTNNITHGMLAELLGQIGVKETKAIIGNKLSLAEQQFLTTWNPIKIGEYNVG